MIREYDRLPRRAWLKTVGAAGAALLGLPALGADDRLKAKAKANLKLGIMSNVYAGLPVAEAARRIKQDGFTCVVTDYTFADARFDILNPDWDLAKKIVSTLEGQGLHIAGMYGYYNVVDPDEARRKRGEAKIEAIMANVKRLGCNLVSTETGTLNPTSEWAESPENDTEAGYQRGRAAFERLTRIAEKNGAVLTIEAYWRNIISSIERDRAPVPRHPLARAQARHGPLQLLPQGRSAEDATHARSHVPAPGKPHRHRPRQGREGLCRRHRLARRRPGRAGLSVVSSPAGAA